MSIIAFDSHKRYTFVRVENKNGEHPEESRIENLALKQKKSLPRRAWVLYYGIF